MSFIVKYYIKYTQYVHKTLGLKMMKLYFDEIYNASVLELAECLEYNDVYEDKILIH